jgi:hypothetical protein
MPGLFLPWLFICLCGTLSAQREQAGLFMVWSTAEVDLRISDELLFILEGSFRRADMFNDPVEIMARPSVEYRPSSRWRLGAGYARFSSHPYGNFPADAFTNEHRYWQEAMYRRNFNAWRPTQRLRLEQRSLEKVPSGDLVNGRYREWQHRFRFRSMLEYRPGFEDEEDRNATGIFVELLMQAGVQQRIHALDQWRAGLQYAFDPLPGLQLIAGYMYQYALANDASHLEHGHVLLLQATLDVDLRRKE